MSKKPIILIRNAKRYDFGGGERFPVFLADILQKNNYKPLIISRSPKLLSFAKDHSLPAIRGPWWSHQDWNGKYALLFPAYIIWQVILFFWYVAIFIKINPASIHIQSKDDFIAATFAGRLLRKHIIWTDHADLKHIWKNIRTWYKNPVGKLVYIAAKLAHNITVVSESERQLVTNNLSTSDRMREKIKVIYNGVSDTSSKYSSIKKAPSVLTFCVASRLVGDKGIGEVIDAFTRLSNEQKDVELVLLGDGPEAEKFKKEAANNRAIQLLGYQKDPLSYLAESDIFIHPTYHEGFSVALVEASMLSLPIIATSVGGNVEIIKDEITGLLIPAKDSDSLYQAMKRLSNDSGLRQKLGSAARKQYEQRFDFDTIVTEEFMPLYEGRSA